MIGCACTSKFRDAQLITDSQYVQCADCNPEVGRKFEIRFDGEVLTDVSLVVRYKGLGE